MGMLHGRNSCSAGCKRVADIGKLGLKLTQAGHMVTFTCIYNWILMALAIA